MYSCDKEEMTVGGERILIVSKSEKDGLEFANAIGVDSDNMLKISTKYYSAEIVVSVITEENLSDYENLGGVVLVECDPKCMHAFSSSGGDTVQLFLSNDPSDESLLALCIDAGFELADVSNTSRIVEALSCRRWQSSAISKGAVLDTSHLTSFEAVMGQMKSIRESGLSDADRRQQAEDLITQLYDLIGSDIDENDSE